MLINYCHTTNERVHNACGSRNGITPEKSQYVTDMFPCVGINMLIIKTPKEETPYKASKS